MGAEIIEKLAKPIEATGADPDAVLKLARHEDPLYLAVHDKNIGMEKLDYLERDGLNTILSRPAGIDYLRKHIYFVAGELMIDEKVIDNAVEVQNFYLKMYKNVYLRKASVIAQRMLQKTVYHSILSGELSAGDLGALTDGELIGIVRTSENPVARTLYDHFKRRDLFREAVTFRHNDFIGAYNQTGKSITVAGLTTEEMEKLIASKLNPKNQKDLEGLEQRIAELSDIPFEEILAVPVFNAWRFKSKDIKIYSERGDHMSLMERFPAHFKNLEEISRSYAAFRICTTEKYREKLSDKTLAKKIFELIFGSIE
jgi:HD superfamily phosphohydrolase